jgi:hypothetical protein
MLHGKQVSIMKEINYIIDRAQNRACHVISWAELVFFSTLSGDAWALDPAESFALCLARDGEKQEFTVAETPDNFKIAWNAHYEIHDEAFVVFSPDGHARSILGYPTGEIARAIQRVSQE